jgi:hypothetical protein
MQQPFPSKTTLPEMVSPGRGEFQTGEAFTLRFARGGLTIEFDFPGKSRLTATPFPRLAACDPRL